MFLINVFLYQFIKIFKNPNNKNVLLFSLPSSLLILLRGEFLVFVILSLLYLLIKHNCIKKVFASLLFILILISPYLYRNYQIFEQVTITKSFGYNLLKGNHPGTAVEGTPMFRTVEKVIPETKKLEELNALGPIKTHDLLKDKILLDQAIIFIKKIQKSILNYILKNFYLFSF